MCRGTNKSAASPHRLSWTRARGCEANNTAGNQPPNLPNSWRDRKEDPEPVRLSKAVGVMPTSSMVHAYFYCFEVAQRRGSEAFSWENSSDLAILQQPSQAYKSRRRVIAFLSRGLSVHLGERIWASLMVCIQGGLKSRSRAVVVTALPQYQVGASRASNSLDVISSRFPLPRCI
jgi:hypothetical protein